MSIRTRLIVALLLITGLGFFKLVDWLIDDLRPRYLEAMEESMVDTATILASWVESQLDDPAIHTADIRAAMLTANERHFSAKIYGLTKTHLDMRVYITDQQGIVLFDSLNGRDEGRNYSLWNDVLRTLRGEYGARSSRTNPDEASSAILHVASPIHHDGQIIGVLTVCKPTDSVTLFLDIARRNTATAGVITAVVVIIFGTCIFYWVTIPINKLKAYALAVRNGSRIPLPALGKGEIRDLGKAFEDMKVALEGREYVEQYVQSLTHEIKSPLSALRGASELLHEEMPIEDRRRFVDNIRTEAERIQAIVDRLLELASIEKRRSLEDVEVISLASLLSEVVESASPSALRRSIQIEVRSDEHTTIRGERFLLRQAIANLLQNAIDFSADGSHIRVRAETVDKSIVIDVEDEGDGIPDYALNHIFDRFYSLKRPHTGRKSSGLGLSFVRESIQLHGGTVDVANRPDARGVLARIVLPCTMR